MRSKLTILACLWLSSCSTPQKELAPASASAPLLCYPVTFEAGGSLWCYPYGGSPNLGALIDSGAAANASSDEIAPLLPWPLPVATGRRDLSASVKATGQYAQIARRIEAKLTPKDYDRLFYYHVDGGFAVVTELERFRPNGEAEPNGRFKQGKVGGYVNWRTHFERMLFGEDGRFRLLIFVVSNKPILHMNRSANASDVVGWNSSEATFSLPPSLAAKVAPAGTKVTMLIYEFEAAKGRDGRLVANSDRHDMSIHSRWLGFET